MIKSLLTAGIGTAVGAIGSALITWFASLIADSILAAMNSGLFEYVTNWMTIPVLGQAILWGQAISIVVVVCIRIAVGINQGILQDEMRAPEYLFKSVGAVVLIGIMPILCSLVITFGQTAVNDLAGYASRSVDVTEIHYAADNIKTIDEVLSDIGDASLIDVLITDASEVTLGSVVTLVVMVLVLLVYLELMVRQVQMLVISVAAPWVGIKIATENSADQYWEYLANLMGMFIVQAIQALFLAICLVQYKVWSGMALNLFDANSGAWYPTIILIALLLGTLSIPSLLDRWTFSGSSGRGGMAMASVVRGARGGRVPVAIGTGGGAGKGAAVAKAASKE